MSWKDRLFKYDVFISYSRSEEALALKLAGHLMDSGLHVFVDREDLRSGDWERQLESAIRMSSACVVLWTVSARESEWVGRELEAFYRQRGSRIIPVVFGDDDWGELRRYLGVRLASLAGDWTSAEVFPLIRLIRDARAGRPGRGPRVRVLGTLPSVSIRTALLLFLLPALLVFSFFAARSFFIEYRHLAKLRTAQRSIQESDLGLRALRPSAGGTYRSPATGAPVARDWFSRGVLRFRHFYADGRLVARDEFLYQDGKPQEKRRIYLDDSQAVFLEDRFGQDGMLIEKLDCPGGGSDCVRRVDQMRSPLPPVLSSVYR